MPTSHTIVPTMTPKAVLDAYALEVRCKLLEIAAILDRHDRGRLAHGDGTSADPRLDRLRRGLAILAEDAATPDRVERIALVFSDAA